MQSSLPPSVGIRASLLFIFIFWPLWDRGIWVNQNKAIQFVSCLTLLAAFAACTDSGSSGTKAGQDPRAFDASKPETYKEVQDFTQMKSSFVSEKVLDLSKPEDAKELSDFRIYGCDKNGNELGTLDPISKIGDSATTSWSVNSQSTHASSISKDTLKSISDKSFTFVSKTLSVFIEEAGGEVLKSIPETEANCKMGSDISGDRCERGQLDISEYLTDKGLEYIKNHPEVGNSNCQIKNPKYVTKNEIGKFKLADNTVVKAHRLTMTSTGDLSCGGFSLGSGSQTYASIRTNQLMPVSDVHYCGGVSAQYSITEYLDKKSINSIKIEILSGTMRK